MSKTSKQSVKAAVSQMCVWDVTIWPESKNDPLYFGSATLIADVEHMRKQLSTICKHYCFQLERGAKTGKFHFQGRFSLKVKDRELGVVESLRDLEIGNFKLSLTSSANKKNDFYVTKEDTRISGPYTDKNYIYIPSDVAKMVVLRPWQATLKNKLSEPSERTVDVMVDFKGNIGKTRFCRYMMVHHDAQLLPFCREYKDILRMTYDVGVKAIYMVDMPRAMPKGKMMEFFSAIESIKSGFAYDDRNTYRQRLFNPPRVIVFTNTKPDTSMLSADMWKFWSVDAKFRLVETPTINDYDNVDESGESTDDIHFNETTSEEAI